MFVKNIKFFKIFQFTTKYTQLYDYSLFSGNPDMLNTSFPILCMSVSFGLQVFRLMFLLYKTAFILSLHAVNVLYGTSIYFCGSWK